MAKIAESVPEFFRITTLVELFNIRPSHFLLQDD